MPVPPQSITSSRTPGATRTIRVVCGVVSTQPAGLKSEAGAAIGAATPRIAAAASANARKVGTVIKLIPLPCKVPGCGRGITEEKRLAGPATDQT